MSSLSRSLFALPLLASTAFTATPVCPKASPAVAATLDFFAAQEGKTERRILSGQFTGYSDQRNATFPEKLAELTGQAPAIVGVDYANHHQGDITVTGPNATALKAWKAGAFVTISTHLYNPLNPKKGGLRDKGVDISRLLVEGTPEHTRWLEELDGIAEGLSALKKQGVVVLWRPFHEMNGDWFWWGAQKPESFKAVWRHLFHYFSEVKQLDNLLWVYSPNQGANADDYYPGDDVVDLVGLDVYANDLEPRHVKGYDAVAKHPKPFGFTEFGPYGQPEPKGDFDYRKLLSGIRAHYPRVTFFLAWDDNWSPLRNTHAKEFYNDPLLLNLAHLPPVTR